MTTAALTNVTLAFPTAIHFTAKTADAAAPRSWIQIARTGSFVSNRYGKFSITPDDLATMLKNFNEVTPKAPTELPVDFDHLSMSPQKPGDGIAAGWIKRLALRDNGASLFAEVAWTADAAALIKKGAYRFVSPSFVKDHTHKNGEKIGTTLIAAAITNHPFLDSMQPLSLTLHTRSALGDLALPTSAGRVVNCAAIGQRVMVMQGDELTPDERAQTYVVADMRHDGDDAFVYLKTIGGQPFGWFKASQLGPARSAPAIPARPTPATPDTQETNMNDDTTAAAQLMTLTTERLTAHPAMHFRDALAQVIREQPALALAHEEGESLPAAPAPVTTALVTLAASPVVAFELAAKAIATRDHVEQRDAYNLAAEQHPDLYSAYRTYTNSGAR